MTFNELSGFLGTVKLKITPVYSYGAYRSRCLTTHTIIFRKFSQCLCYTYKYIDTSTYNTKSFFHYHKYSKLIACRETLLNKVGKHKLSTVNTLN